MKQGFQGMATLLLSLAIVGVVGLQAHQGESTLDEAPPGSSAAQTQAVLEGCKIQPGAHAPSTLPRTQAPLWLQQNQADVERCLRGKLYASAASQPRLAEAQLALKATR